MCQLVEGFVPMHANGAKCIVKNATLDKWHSSTCETNPLWQCVQHCTCVWDMMACVPYIYQV